MLKGKGVQFIASLIPCVDIIIWTSVWSLDIFGKYASKFLKFKKKQMDPEEPTEQIIIGEKVIPYIRVYISVGKENHDMLTVDQISSLLQQDCASPVENIKSYMDKGMVNIYACEYDKVMKII